MQKPRIIVITGPSSGGKTSLACALQERLKDVFWRCSVDDFISMLPEKHRRDENLLTEAILSTAEMGLHSATKGQNVIIDGVFLSFFLRELREAFAPVAKLDVVVVTAPYSVLKSREDARPNRDPEWLEQNKFFRFSKGVDIRINSAKTTIVQSVEDVAKKLKLKLDY